MPAKTHIRLMAVDIDGCITDGEGHAADLDVLQGLRAFNERAARREPGIPEVTLLTGRQQPYVELMSQMMGTRVPAVFENGAGLFIPDSYEFLFHPSITPDNLEQLSRLKKRIHDELVRPGLAKLQPGKEVSLSVYPASGGTVKDIAGRLRRLIEIERAIFELDISLLCVNVLFPGINKGAGVIWLAEYLGIDTINIGVIGDAPGDIVAFESGGVSGAPAQAGPDVRRAVNYVASQPNGHGVLEIIEWIIRINAE